jgi:hypothetical protein
MQAERLMQAAAPQFVGIERKQLLALRIVRGQKTRADQFCPQSPLAARAPRDLSPHTACGAALRVLR